MKQWKMKTEKSFYRYRRLEKENSRSEFDDLFENDNIVDKSIRDQQESILR